MDSGGLRSLVVAEIEELHRCFEAIFAGDAHALERVDAALGPGFAMVPPSGGIIDRGQVLAGLEGSVGSQPMTIRIIEPVLRWTGAGAVAASYEEWQDTAAGTTARQASVLFEVDPTAPGGLRWMWVHETWMDQ